MSYTEHLSKFHIIGDKVLIIPQKHKNLTRGGLYLPPGVKEKEAIQTGYIVKVGPGYPIPFPRDVDEPWKPTNREPEYIPLQTREGDLAIYLQNSAYEFEYEGEKYVIVPHHAILMVIREEDEF